MQEAKDGRIFSSETEHREFVPWWRSGTGIVFLIILLFFVYAAALIIPRLSSTRTVLVNGLEVLRDIKPARILISPKEARQMARLHLEKLIGAAPGAELREYARPWSSDPVSRYYALFENSIDAFYNLLDSYIIREGWRVDFLDTRDNSFPWSVFLDSSGKLLCCQNNPTHPDKPGAITEAEARLTAQSYLTPTVYGSIPSFHESSAVPLPDQHQWLFSFSDSLDHKLVSGRVQLQLVIGAGGVTSFQPGISMPPDHAASIAAAEQLTRRMKIGALVVILLFMIRLFVFTLGRFRRGEWDRGTFWRSLLLLLPMILYNVYDRNHQLRLWVSEPGLPVISGAVFYGAGALFALFISMFLAWSLKWMREREIDPHYMPLVAGRVPLINLSSFLSLLGVILMVVNMGLAHMFAGPSEALPIYSNRISLSFIMFAMYLLILGFLIFIVWRWEQIRRRTAPRIIAGLVAFLVITSIITLSTLPLFEGPFQARLLIMFFCFIPFTGITALLLLYQMRIRMWYLCSLTWLAAPVLCEFLSPSHKYGGENTFIIVALVALYGWILIVLPERKRKQTP